MQPNNQRVAPKPQSAFARFLLKSWQPIPTWQSTIILFLVLGLALIGFGIVLLAINADIKEKKFQYDDSCLITTSEDKPCVIDVKIEEKMEKPVFLYYEIDNFYQNHRRYINSRSTKQLSGEKYSEPQGSHGDCYPANSNGAMGKDKAIDGTPLKADDTAIPCGLIAKSLFNDTYKLYTKDETKNIVINETGIAWPSDKGTKFKNPTPFDKSVQWIDMEDEHFIVWMRTAGLPDFRKLWGRIDEDLPAGDYKMKIMNYYPVSQFDGEKRFVFSTTGPFGGKNPFLAISYLVVGGVCLGVAVFFYFRWMQYSSKKNQ